MSWKTNQVHSLYRLTEIISAADNFGTCVEKPIALTQYNHVVSEIINIIYSCKQQKISSTSKFKQLCLYHLLADKLANDTYSTQY